MRYTTGPPIPPSTTTTPLLLQETIRYSLNVPLGDGTVLPLPVDFGPAAASLATGDTVSVVLTATAPAPPTAAAGNQRRHHHHRQRAALLEGDVRAGAARRSLASSQDGLALDPAELLGLSLTASNVSRVVSFFGGDNDAAAGGGQTANITSITFWFRGALRGRGCGGAPLRWHEVHRSNGLRPHPLVFCTAACMHGMGAAGPLHQPHAKGGLGKPACDGFACMQPYWQH